MSRRFQIMKRHSSLPALSGCALLGSRELLLKPKLVEMTHVHVEAEKSTRDAAPIAQYDHSVVSASKGVCPAGSVVGARR
jgi:hypothetical protein